MFRPHHLLLVCVALLLSAKGHGYVPAEGAARELQQGISRAVASGAPGFGLPPGDFYFNDDALNITAANSFALVGDDTRLVFRAGGGVLLKDCVAVNISSLRIDYSPLPYAHGRVVRVLPSSMDGRVTAHVSLSVGSLTPEDLIAQYPPSDTWPPIAVFDQGFALRCAPCGWGQVSRFKSSCNKDWMLPSVWCFLNLFPPFQTRPTTGTINEAGRKPSLRVGTVP